MIFNETIREFFKNLPQKSVARKKHLYFKSSKKHHLYILLQGCLKAYYINDNAQEIIRTFYLPGDIIGLNKLYDEHALFNIQAITNSKVIVVHENTPHNINFLKECLKQAINSEKQHSLILSAPTLEASIATFFIIYLKNSIQKYGAKKTFELPINMVELSKYLSLANESLSRFLSDFKKQQILEIEKHVIIHYDINKLTKLANVQETPEIIIDF